MALGLSEGGAMAVDWVLLRPPTPFAATQFPQLLDARVYPLAWLRAHSGRKTKREARFPVEKWKLRTRDKLAPKCVASVADKPMGTEKMLVFVPSHPLIKHWVAVLRNESTPSPLFKGAMAELGRLLIYEASRDWLITMTGEVQTPCGVAEVEFIDPGEPVKVVPILRAGLVLVEHVSSVFPLTQTYHLGFVRDETTLQPTLYLNKLPEKLPEDSRVLIADPMLATGGTMIAAIEELKKRGVNHTLMRVVCAVAAPPALKKLSEKFPGLKVYAGVIDPELNDKGYIVPGLGDAGDRSFAT